jgi:hypothetical protein
MRRQAQRQLACSVPAQMLGGCKMATTPAANPPVVQVTSSTPGTFQLTVPTTQPGSSGVSGRQIRGLPLLRLDGVACLVSALMIVLVGFTIAESKIDTKRLSAAAAGSLVLAFTLARAACGGGGAPSPDPSAGSPPGTYNNHSRSEHHGQRRPSIYQTMTIPSTIQ